jgi:hypothetical protein
MNRLSGLLARVVAALRAAADPESRRTQVRETFRRLAKMRHGVRLEGDLKAIGREGLD